MTNEQFKKAKTLRRQLRSEKYHLTNLEFDHKMGGRRGGYENSPVPGADKKLAEGEIIRVKQRIAALKADFAAL